MDRNSITMPRQPVSLSHLEREQHTQSIRKQIDSISLEHLRLLRAWLLDVAQKKLTIHEDLAMLRGSLVHEEILAREGSLVTRLRRIGVGTHKPYVNHLASFPDAEKKLV